MDARPWLGRLLGTLPTAAMEQVGGDPHGLVLRLDGDGGIVDGLHDPDGRVSGVTSAAPLGGALYLGSRFGERVVQSPTVRPRFPGLQFHSALAIL